MKILGMLAMLLFFATANASANQSVSEKIQFVAGPSDAEVKKLVMYMIKVCNLNPDQQLKVKEAAMKMASDAAVQKPLDATKRDKLRNDFSLTMSNMLGSEQYAQYKGNLNEAYRLLDDIINAAQK